MVVPVRVARFLWLKDDGDNYDDEDVALGRISSGYGLYDTGSPGSSQSKPQRSSTTPVTHKTDRKKNSNSLPSHNFTFTLVTLSLSLYISLSIPSCLNIHLYKHLCPVLQRNFSNSLRILSPILLVRLVIFVRKTWDDFCSFSSQ